MIAIKAARLEFTEDQVRAQEAIIDFVRKRGSMLTVGGYAGTGKTTTLAESIAELRRMKQFKDLQIAFCCFTGKAATVLREKLIKAGALGDTEYCGTIHGLIYKPVMDQNERIVDWRLVEELQEKLIVIDEASMVGETILADLQSYGIPIIAVGDHGQLPPVMSKLNLMENPMVRLEKIHRQAEGNPIIKWSMKARFGEEIPFDTLTGPGGEHVQKTMLPYRSIIQSQLLNEDEKLPMILCGINRTRVAVNQLVREIKGHKGLIPFYGETVICLKNNRRQKIYNGMVGKLEAIDTLNDPDFYRVQVLFELGAFKWAGEIFAHQFNKEYPLRSWQDWRTKKQFTEMEIGNLFDYGYCLTVHKSQGSQADSVVVIEEKVRGTSQENFQRWLYTAITRASKNLIIVKNA